MGDCVEGCREVQQDETIDVTRNSSDEEVNSDIDERGLHAMVCSEARLKGIIELMVRHVLMELGRNCSF